MAPPRKDLKLPGLLKRLRRERGLTQETFAEMIGLSSDTISRYERGERRVHGDTLKKVATELQLPEDEGAQLWDAWRLDEDLWDAESVVAVDEVLADQSSSASAQEQHIPA